jgi:protoheme IX farnesyltransferase
MISTALKRFWSYLSLIRILLSLAVGFSALAGFICKNHFLNLQAWFVFLGVFLLASGASAFNQVQERDYDARMKRTMKRPIPAGLISIPVAIIISIILIAFGLQILFYYGNLNSMLVGLFSVLWYNFIYTYLKRKTAYSVFVGIFTGIGPIFIGWLAAGGNWYNRECLLIATFMSVWQMPHFLLLMLRYEDDYRNAGFPLLTDNCGIPLVKAIILLSAVFISVIALMLVKFAVINSIGLQLLAVSVSILMLMVLILKLFRKENYYRSLLMTVNIYMMLIMLCIFFDNIRFS